MTQAAQNVERTGFRDEAYSRWHRKLSKPGHRQLRFINLDWLEQCDECYRTVAVLELAYDNGEQDHKAAYATRETARALRAPGYVVLYRRTADGLIDSVRVRQIAPVESQEYVAYSAERWAHHLYDLRSCHPIPQADRVSVPRQSSWLDETF